MDSSNQAVSPLRQRMLKQFTPTGTLRAHASIQISIAASLNARRFYRRGFLPRGLYDAHPLW